MRSVDLTDEALSAADAVLIVADHSAVDYARVVGLSADLSTRIEAAPASP